MSKTMLSLFVLSSFFIVTHTHFTSACTDNNPEICECMGSHYYVCEHEFINQYNSDCYHDDLNPSCRPFLPQPKEVQGDEDDVDLSNSRYTNVGTSYSCPVESPPKCKCWFKYSICLDEFLNVYDKTC